ncbi:hypothetical protein SHKM778_95130 (plasmid) [Streptomyces sp. KM77-8]|uniref:Uncharacterized protein n=1 Tax=Streptomyces haneummycinicus TaxID=3074435 RepID=A0AAT9HZP6_9ACTN
MISLEPRKTYRFSVMKLLIRLQNFRLPRKRTVLIPFLGIYVTLMVTAQSAWAKDYTPVGIGDLLPSVDIPYTKGQGTLYEEYGNPSSTRSPTTTACGTSWTRCWRSRRSSAWPSPPWSAPPPSPSSSGSST